jgi:hypothetical protein
MRWGKVQNYLSVRTEEQFFAAFLEAKLLPSSSNRLAGGRQAGTNLCKPTSTMVTGALQASRSARDAGAEVAFLCLYGTSWPYLPSMCTTPTNCNESCC